jgi:hypothetical protein
MWILVIGVLICVASASLSMDGNDNDNEYYRVPRYENDPSLQTAKLVWHRSLFAHDQVVSKPLLHSYHSPHYLLSIYITIYDY